MIKVITTVELRPDALREFLDILEENIPKVKAEKGCLGYEPLVDVDSGLPIQGEVRQDTVTLIETWESLDVLGAHLRASHMAAFRKAAAGYVQSVNHQILQPA